MEKVTFLNSGALKRFIQKRRGQVSVFIFWVSWCDSCLKDLVHIGGLGRRYRDRGLQVAAISVNPVKDQKKVAEIYQLVQGDLLAYQSSEPFAKIISVLDSRGLDIVPVAYLLNRQGEITRFIGRRSVQSLEKSLQRALGS